MSGRAGPRDNSPRSQRFHSSTLRLRDKLPALSLLSVRAYSVVQYLPGRASRPRAAPDPRAGAHCVVPQGQLSLAFSPQMVQVKRSRNSLARAFLASYSFTFSTYSCFIPCRGVGVKAARGVGKLGFATLAEQRVLSELLEFEKALAPLRARYGASYQAVPWGKCLRMARRNKCSAVC